MGFRDLLAKWFGGDRDAQVSQHARGIGREAEDHFAGGIVAADRGLDSYLRGATSIDTDLMGRYADYERMDDSAELSAALSLFADDSTTPDTMRNRTMWAKSKDRVVRDVIDDLLARRLRIDDDIWPAVRGLSKMGNLYAEIVATEAGVVGLNFLSAPTMRRVVDCRGATLGYVQDLSGKFGSFVRDFPAMLKSRDRQRSVTVQGDDDGQMCTRRVVVFHPWEVVHWRLRGKRIRSIYGYGLLDGARGTWKRLQLLEDAVLIHRLTKGVGRYAFYIDTGDLPTKDAMARVKQVRQQYKKKRLINPATGELELRMNPASADEDFWIPTRGAKESTRIEVLSGPDWPAKDDLDYFRNKLFAAIMVPPAYLGGSEGMMEPSKASLAQEDVRFARTCMRIQREWINGMRQVVRVHLAALNIDPDTVEWDIVMAAPSSIMELAQIEVLNARMDLARSMSEWLPREMVMQRVLHFSEEEALFAIRGKRDEQSDDVKREAQTQDSIRREYPEVAMGAVDTGGDEVPPEGAPVRMMAQGAAEGVSGIARELRAIVESSRRAEGAALRAGQRAGEATKEVRALARRTNEATRALNERLRRRG